MENQFPHTERAQELSYHDPNIEWAIRQIELRIGEYREFCQLSETGPHDQRFDDLEERSMEMMAEIAHIAFHAQLTFDLEVSDYNPAEALEAALSMVHYITSDATDYEIIVREDSDSDSD